MHIDTTVQPVAQPLRRPAFSLREKIEKKLDELLHEDIIERVDGPTPWVNPVVVVPKPNGKVRLCVDMRCANKAIIRERHPIPTIDKVLNDMQEGSVFSKLDLKWGYHQIELSTESRDITTFVTHKGLFRYRRLMFGISSAPEKYQQVIQQVLHDCSGTANISDDIIVYGPDTDEHDRRLEQVLIRLKEKGLTLNKKKCVFHMPKLTFMGLVLSQRGIGPTEEKVNAVTEAREPQNVSEVKSFLGLVNFNARFIPDLAIVTEPLRRLTKKGETFIFGPEQQTAFTELKQRMAKAETLGYFARNAKRKIIADASPVGLGAIIFAVTDYYSRYVEISISKRNTADVAINELEKMFATHGLPCSVTSDNGPHFIADSFETFLTNNGIEHRKTPPLWPQANGEIERQNRSLLKRMQIAQAEGQDWKTAVQTYLVAYRNTPHPSTGVCPSELLFRRKLRTKLPELQEAVKLDEVVRDRDKDRNAKMKDYADRRRHAEESTLTEGGKVLLKQQRVNKWTPTLRISHMKWLTSVATVFWSSHPIESNIKRTPLM